MAKRLICVLISVLMIVSLLPTGVFADSSGSTDGTVTADSTTDDSGSTEETAESVGEGVNVAASQTGSTEKTEDSVASVTIVTIDDTTTYYYTSVTDAVSAIESSGTLAILQECDTDFTVANGITITLDSQTDYHGDITVASGGTLIFDSTYDMMDGEVTVSGTLTVNKGSVGKTTLNSGATMTITGGGAQGITVSEGATLNVNGGSVSGEYDLILNGGTVNVTGGTVEEVTVNSGSLNISGGNVSQTLVVSGGTVTMTGGTISGGTDVTVSGGTMNVSGGTVRSAVTVTDGTLNVSDSASLTSGITLSGSGSVNISGGTVTMNGSGAEKTIVVSSAATGTVSITGGTVTNNSEFNTDKTVFSVEEDSTATVTVTGGTFSTSSDISSYIAEGYAIDSDGTVVSTSSYVAKLTVGETTTYYSTLAEAIDAVSVGTSADNLGEETTITILCDIDDAEGISIPSYVNLTIDFNNTTYTLTGPGAGSTGTETIGFQLLKDSTIVMKNGTIKIAEDANNIKRIIQNYSNLTLQDMQIYSENQVGGEDYCLSFLAGSITFSGNTSIISSESAGSSVIAFDIDHASSTAMYYSSVSVTFDSTYSGTISGQIVYDTKDVDLASLTIEADGNGTFSGGIVLSSTTSNLGADPKITISSGTFSTNVDEYCATGYAAVYSSDGTVKYTIASGVAGIYDSEGNCTAVYSSLSDAVSESGNNDTIVLLTDVTLTSSGNFSSELYISSGTVSIDLNGHDIYCGSITYPIYVASGATLNISDSSSTSTNEQGTISVAGTYGIYCYGTLNITGGNISSSSSSSAVLIYGGSISMTGGSLKTSSQMGIWLYEATSATLSDCTITTSYSGWGYAVYCSSCTGKVSMSSVTIDADGTHNCGLALLSYTEAELQNCNIHTEYWYCIANNGADSEVKLTINGGTYTADDCTVLYLPNVNATTAISDATITGSCGIEIRGGTLTLTDCTVTGTNSSYIYQSNGSGNTIYGPAIAISQHTTKGTISVTINGGTYSAYNAPAIVQKNLNAGSSDDVSKISLSISSGTFTGYSSDSNKSTAIELESVSDGMNSSISSGSFSSVVPVEYCATGYAPVTVATDGLYTVTEAVAAGYKDGEYVAPYTTLSAALSASTDDIDTIKLLVDIGIDSTGLTASTSGTYTIDLNGYDLTIDSSATLTISSGVTIVIEDSESAGLVTNNGTISVDGTLDIRDLAYTTDAESGYGLLGSQSGVISLSSTGTFIVPDVWATYWSETQGAWDPTWWTAAHIFSNVTSGAKVYASGTGWTCTQGFSGSYTNNDGTKYWSTSSTYLVEYYKHSAAESEGNTWSYPVSSDSNEIFAGWYSDSSYTTAYLGTSGVAYAKFVKLTWSIDDTEGTDTCGIINFLGGSLRTDYGTDYTKTSLRFGYDIIIPDGVTEYSWTWVWTGDGSTHTVSGSYYSTSTEKTNSSIGSTVRRSNLVITGIPSTAYSTDISCTLTLTYVTGDGTTVAAEQVSASTRSVKTVATAISGDESSSYKSYAESILAQISDS